MHRLTLLFVLPLLLLGAVASAQTPSITFYANWAEVASPNPLPVGTQAKIVYDSTRLSQCRGTTNTGGPAWSITGYYQLNGGPVQSFWVAGHSPTPNPLQPTISLSARGDVALWFQVSNLWGCNAWDSDFGNNYHFTIN